MLPIILKILDKMFMSLIRAVDEILVDLPTGYLLCNERPVSEVKLSLKQGVEGHGALRCRGFHIF
jgi:hypothetical protein